MKKSKTLYMVMISILVIALAVCILPWQSNIENTLYGLQCRIGDSEYMEDVEVYIKGIYKKYLIKNDIFEGIIEVSGYDFTFDGLPVNLEFYDGFSNLFYSGNLNGKPVHNMLGMICITPDFSQLLICVSENVNNTNKAWNGESGLFISVPAEDINQAFRVAKELGNKSEFLSSVLWD